MFKSEEAEKLLAEINRACAGLRQTIDGVQGAFTFVIGWVDKTTAEHSAQAQSAHTVRLLTVKDAADYLRVSERTIREYVAQGKLTCRRVVGEIRFDPGELDQWTQNNVRQNKTQLKAVK